MKKLRRILSTLLRAKQRIKYHSFDTLTLYEWNKILNGEVGYCIVNYEENKRIGDENELKQAYFSIYDHYLKTYDSDNKNRDKLHRLLVTISNMKLRVMRNFEENGYLVNNINLKENELNTFLDELSKQQKELNMDNIRMLASKEMHFYIDEKIILAKDFYSILNNLKKQENG